MANFRSYQQFNFKNPNFIVIALALLVVFYLYAYESVILQGKQFIYPWLIITSAFFVLTIWSYIMATITSPGEVPIYWALYNKTTEERKYCLICHNFKPERTHHCSKCNKCVLNMDHHCPWINNCVGFYNRKYFVLFLVYIFIAMLLGLIQVAIIEYHEIMELSQGNRTFNIHTFLRMAGLAFLSLMIIPVFLFMVMHVRMVLENSSTIQEMVRDKKRIGGDPAKLDGDMQFNKYDIGQWYNCTQVFGQNIFHWFIPIQDEKPLKGKGWSWLKKTDKDQYGHYGMYDCRT